MDTNLEQEHCISPEVYQKHAAWFWIRGVAMMIDGGILWLVFLGIGLLFDAPDAIDTSWLGAGIAWLYFVVQESSAKRATIGKRMMGIYVAGLNGGRISFWRATGRFFGKWISLALLGIGYLIQPFTARRQALHDMMAECLVLQKPGLYNQMRGHEFQRM